MDKKRFLFLFKKEIFSLSLLNLFSGSFLLIAPYLSKLFVDNAFLGRDFAKYTRLAFLSGAVFLFSAVFQLIQETAKNKIALKLKVRLLNGFLRKFYSLDLSFFNLKSTGENIFRFFDAENIARLVSEQLPLALAEAAKLPVILIVCFMLDARLTLLLLLLSPLFLLRSLYFQKKALSLYEEIWRQRMQLSRKIHDSFSKMILIKALGLEHFERRNYLRLMIENTRRALRGMRWQAAANMSAAVFSKAIYGITALYGGRLIIEGKLSLGSFSAVMLYIAQLAGILDSLARKLEYFGRESVSLDKFFEVAKSRPQIQDLPKAKDIASFKGEISFRKVGFSYAGRKNIFQDLDLNIPPSSWTAITGPSGCGKTTLINLLLRLYEPQAGQILIDGLPLESIKLSALRLRVGIAAQQPFLFDVSAGENIAYGLKGATRQKIEDAAAVACVHDFIAALPEGYDSLIGDDACRLSQGLKQRLAIARAILRNPDILIFDEAASSIDSPTEERIFQNLRQRRKGLSTIVVSHRLSAVTCADRVYFLDAQKLESGSHDELMEKSSCYRDFFRHQLFLCRD